MRTNRSAKQNETHPLSSHVNAFKFYLLHQGYAKNTVRLHVSAVNHFGFWLKKSKIKLSDVDDDIILKYIDTLKINSIPTSASRKSRSALPHLAVFLRAGGIIKQPEHKSLSNIEAWLSNFDDYLCEVVGLSRGTRLKYCHYPPRSGLLTVPN